MQQFELVAKILSLSMLSLTLIFTLGIIWRVEMKLDAAYKVFFMALLVLLFLEVTELFVAEENFSIIEQIGKLVSSFFLLAGVWMMRNLFRNIDGEKQ